MSKQTGMNYRIIIEIEASGKKWYYVQYRYLLFFWRYYTAIRDISMYAYKIVRAGRMKYAYKIGWETLEEAEQHIQREIDYEYAQEQRKIVKREVFTYKGGEQ